MNNIVHKFPPVVELNVGGKHFTTALSTLTKYDGTMIASMFSGKFNVLTDQNGRYFIDTDGDYFKYILNYLRYGEIPPIGVTNEVYREANYFGLQGLVEQLERSPSILAKIHRDSYRSQFPGYDEAVSRIVDIICDMSTANTERTSEIVILFHSNNRQPKLSLFDTNHRCVFKSNRSEMTMADVSIGPWSRVVADKVVIACIAKDMENKGFVVTHDYLGQCGYTCEMDLSSGIQSELCQKKFYRLTFHWWA